MGRYRTDRQTDVEAGRDPKPNEGDNSTKMHETEKGQADRRKFSATRRDATRGR